LKGLENRAPAPRGCCSSSRSDSLCRPMRHVRWNPDRAKPRKGLLISMYMSFWSVAFGINEA